MDTAAIDGVRFRRAPAGKFIVAANSALGDKGFSCDFGGKPVNAEITSKDTAGLSFAAITASEHVVTRPRSHASVGRFFLTFQLDGECSVSQADRPAKLQPGDFTILDSWQPIQIEFGGNARQLVIRLHEETTLTRLIHAFQPKHLVFEGSAGTGSLTSGFAQSLLAEADRLSERSLTDASGILVELLRSSFLARYEEQPVVGSRYKAMQIERILQFAESNLANRDLSPAFLAEAHGISQRYLSMLFADQGQTVNGYIWQRRLERCRDEILDPRLRDRSLTEVAHSWGFKCSAHFSRSFKREYGVTPSHFRKMQARKPLN